MSLKQKPNRNYLYLLVLVVFLAAFFYTDSKFSLVSADVEPTPGPDRTKIITVESIAYDWWLVYWSDNSVVCSFSVDHEDKPTADEVFKECGNAIYEKWRNPPPCSGNESGSGLQDCKGMYLHSIGSHSVEKTVSVDLPPAEVWISIKDCVFDTELNRCQGLPSLHFSGEEKLPNETIKSIQGEIDGVAFFCSSSECNVPITPTDEQGVSITFWGNSSYGDSSEVYEGLVRVVPLNTPLNTGTASTETAPFYVDIMSPQWKGDQVPNCAAIWQVFPEINGPPDWLDSPSNVTGLNSTLSLYYLAGMLIQNGSVDANTCQNGGLETEITANQCGLETALNAVNEWQNQFDDEIFNISQELNIPGQLLKNIFVTESQLWPGIYNDIHEVGFGALTENGADAALLWNNTFFDQFCPLVLAQQSCDRGYNNLDAAQKSTLRGALLQKVNASCADCPMGIDLSQANFSIRIFAETLIGNCSQVDRVIYNVTNQKSGQVSSYNDLWRFTLVNYNAGTGCLYTAMNRTWKAKESLDWVHVATNLEPACQGAVAYVDRVSGGDTQEIRVFSTMLPSATATSRKPTPTLTLTRTPAPTQTPTATATSVPMEGPSPTASETPTITPTTTFP
jgi:hypothetical protein